MLEVKLKALLDGAPAGVDAALDVVAGLDEALVTGFARLGPERAEALTAFAGALAGTPLGARLGEAVEKAVAGSVSDEHLAALAGGRSAVLGAVHDALLDGLDEALGRSRTAWQTTPDAAVTPSSAAAASTGSGGGAATSDSAEAATETLGDDAAGAASASVVGALAGCRAWLREVAITGWRGVDHELTTACDRVVEALLAVPGLRGLAVLVDGLAAELRALSPLATAERVPARRWADMWARGLLLAQAGAWHGDVAEVVSGRLLLLGVDVQEHGTAVRAQVYAVLEPAGGRPSRLVRTSVAAAKVETIVGSAVWRLLGAHPVLMGALADHRSVEITDMPLLAGGDLVWHDDRAMASTPADPFTTARVQLAEASAPPVTPLDRHPVQIAEPVLVEGYSSDGRLVRLGETALPVDLDRLPAHGPVTAGLVAASSACIGLMRWDGGRWLLQPLAVQATVKRKAVVAHTGDWAMGPTDPKVVKAEAKAGDAVAVLRERARRLLRR
ncbi:hypothetical protein [Sinosporangium siamense]|uniref:Uncharacterized protein n=1 Tax=Sinosporangium siamense TaxID=1367973 RepID=A0A919V4W0_9ACTN|nr:hypothetical protein [Sinosporangium siamense]GII90166.1 hypothetical protein Ssi02_03970 [Sinosporangium siamense]